MSFKKMLVAVALCSTFAAQADSQSFYVGAQYNKTTLKEKDSGLSVSVDFGSLTALAGYQFNDYFAVEGRVGTGVSDKSFSEDGYKETFGIDTQTMLLGKASYKLSNEFSLFAVAGYSKTEFEYKETGPSYSFSEKDSLSGFALGIGGEYRFANDIAINVEYIMLPDETFRDGQYSAKLEGNNLSVGLSYYF